jgi:PAS domain S-box-containing protein
MAASNNPSEDPGASGPPNAAELIAKALAWDDFPTPADSQHLAEAAQNILETIASFNPLAHDSPEHTAGPSAELPGASSAESSNAWNAELRYRALVEKIPAVTFMAALDETVHDLYVSPQIEALLGFSQKQWLDDPFLWYYQLHPEDRARWANEFARTCAIGVQFRSEYRLIARDGRVVWVHGECQIIRDRNGRPMYLQGIAFDITESKRAEEVLRRAHDDLDAAVRERTSELAKANEALRAEVEERKVIEAELLNSVAAVEAANKAKDQFLAVLSHELRTPLTPVLTTVQMLERDQAMSLEAREALAMVRRNIQLEARLIDDLLDLTRIARGKIQLHHAEVDAHETLRHAVQVCQSQIDAKGLEVTQILRASSRYVWADPTRLQQMLWNLVSNAVKFTPNEGRIIIRTFNTGGLLVVQISDTGVGIAPDVLPRLFDAFQQGEQTISRRFGGLGLGLMITRSLAELHHGTITAESEGPGKGATFTLRLDALQKSATRNHNGHSSDLAGAPSVPEGVPSKRQNILLVEDNEDTLRVMAKMLRNFGYAVKTATGVKAALELAEKEEFNLLVSDIGLPDGSGWDIMRQLRAKQTVRGIALSGYGMDEDLRKSREAGFEHHLVKPISFDMLQNVIERVAGTL